MRVQALLVGAAAFVASANADAQSVLKDATDSAASVATEASSSIASVVESATSSALPTFTVSLPASSD